MIGRRKLCTGDSEKPKKLEQTFGLKAESAENEARELAESGNKEGAMLLLNCVTDECTLTLFDFAVRENKRLAERINALGGLYGRQKEAIEKYAEYAEIEFLIETAITRDIE